MVGTNKEKEDQEVYTRKMFMLGALTGTLMGVIVYIAGKLKWLSYNYGTSLMILVLVVIHIALLSKNKQDEKKMRTIRYSYTINALFWLLAALIFLINMIK